jgi:hypothetical protein
MTIASDLDDVAELCKVAAKRVLHTMLELGPKPQETLQALLWEQQATRLQGQLNSLSALVSKLTAAAVIEGLKPFQEELDTISDISKNAESRIKKVKQVSDLLIKLASILDLGLALLATAAAPSTVSIAAVVKAGTAVADNFSL